MADRRDDSALPRRGLGPKSGSAADSTGESKSAQVVDKVKETVKETIATAGENLKEARTAPRQGAAVSTRPGQKKPTRRARLRLTRIDPWSVMKTSFLLSIAFAIVTVVAVGVVWGVLGAAGVWDSINQMVEKVVGGESGSTFDIEDYLGTSRVMGFTMLVAAIDVLLLTAVATLAAFLYNLAAALLGGIEVTLSEDAR